MPINSSTARLDMKIMLRSSEDECSVDWIDHPTEVKLDKA